MSQQLTIDRRRADYEFRWLAAVGMIAFLVAAACGSFIVVAAGMMMWGGFGMLARSFVPGRAFQERPSRLLAQVPHPERGSDGRPTWPYDCQMVQTRGDNRRPSGGAETRRQRLGPDDCPNGCFGSLSGMGRPCSAPTGRDRHACSVVRVRQQPLVAGIEVTSRHLGKQVVNQMKAVVPGK